MSDTLLNSQANFGKGEEGRIAMSPITLLIVSLGLAALPLVYQLLPSPSSGLGEQGSEVAQALRGGGDLTEQLGATAAGSGLPSGRAAQEQEVAAYLDQKL
ncbi:MAG: hypothetical protein ACO24Y_07185 [Hylemonella sp.]